MIYSCKKLYSKQGGGKMICEDRLKIDILEIEKIK